MWSTIPIAGIHSATRWPTLWPGVYDLATMLGGVPCWSRRNTPSIGWCYMLGEFLHRDRSMLTTYSTDESRQFFVGGTVVVHYSWNGLNFSTLKTGESVFILWWWLVSKRVRIFRLDFGFGKNISTNDHFYQLLIMTLLLKVLQFLSIGNYVPFQVENRKDCHF